jgi:hypothetical protein
MYAQKLTKSAMLAFSAGAYGALVNSIILFLIARAGFDALFGSIPLSDWSFAWMYARICWGGLLAFVFLIPVLKNRWFVRGLVWAVLPTVLAMGSMGFPAEGKLGMMVVFLLFAYVMNVVWAVTASYFYDLGQKAA